MSKWLQFNYTQAKCNQSIFYYAHLNIIISCLIKSYLIILNQRFVLCHRWYLLWNDIWTTILKQLWQFFLSYSHCVFIFYFYCFSFCVNIYIFLDILIVPQVVSKNSCSNNISRIYIPIWILIIVNPQIYID